MPRNIFKKRIMTINKKIIYYFFIIFQFFNFISVNAEEEEIYLKSISDQIQVLTKDLKTLEKAVYQKSDISSSNVSSSFKSDGLNEDILTKHLLKLNEIEDHIFNLSKSTFIFCE